MRKNLTDCCDYIGDDAAVVVADVLMSEKLMSQAPHSISTTITTTKSAIGFDTYKQYKC